MINKHQIEQEIARFEKEYDDVSNLHGRLRNALRKAIDPKIEFKLEKDIEEVELQRNEIEQRIRALKATLGASGPELLVSTDSSRWDKGPFIVYNCNRSDQDKEFNDYFRDCVKFRARYPQIYIIHGESEECHSSLTQRFYLKRIQAHARFLAKRDAQRAYVPVWNIKGPGKEWPDKDRLVEQRLTRLLTLLFDEYDPNYLIEHDCSAKSFRELLLTLPHFVIVIEHDLLAETWDDNTKKVISEYLKFWDDVKGDAHIPQIVVFLNIMYPTIRGGNTLMPWRRLKRQRQESINLSIEGALKRIGSVPGRNLLTNPTAKSSPCMMLPRLSRVRKKDLEDWFNYYKIGNKTYRDEKCKKVFRRDVPEHMSVVEETLVQVYEEKIGGRML